MQWRCGCLQQDCGLLQTQAVSGADVRELLGLTHLLEIAFEDASGRVRDHVRVQWVGSCLLYTSRTVKRVKDSGKGGKGVGARLDHFTHDIDLDSTDAAECQTDVRGRDVYKRQVYYLNIPNYLKAFSF